MKSTRAGYGMTLEKCRISNDKSEKYQNGDGCEAGVRSKDAREQKQIERKTSDRRWSETVQDWWCMKQRFRALNQILHDPFGWMERDEIPFNSQHWLEGHPESHDPPNTKSNINFWWHDKSGMRSAQQAESGAINKTEQPCNCFWWTWCGTMSSQKLVWETFFCCPKIVVPAWIDNTRFSQCWMNGACFQEWILVGAFWVTVS